MGDNGKTATVNGPIEVVAAKDEPFELLSSNLPAGDRRRAVYSNAISGSGHLAMNNTYTSIAGRMDCYLYGDNSAFTGTLGTRGSGFYLYLANQNAPGGALEEFTADALWLADGGNIVLQGFARKTLSPYNRGLTLLGGGGALHIDKNTSAYMTLAMDIAGDGGLEKYGGYLYHSGTWSATGDIGIRENWLDVSRTSFTGSRKINVYNGGGICGTQASLSGQSIEIFEGGAIAIGGSELTLENAVLHSGAVYQWNYSLAKRTCDTLNLTGENTAVEGGIVLRPAGGAWTYYPETVRLPALTVPSSSPIVQGDVVFDDSNAGWIAARTDPLGLVDVSIQMEEADGVKTFYVVYSQSVVTLTRDAPDSWSVSANWSNNKAAESGHDYLCQPVSGKAASIRSPDANNTTMQTFPGDSLTLKGTSHSAQGGLSLMSKSTRIDDLRMAGFGVIGIARSYGTFTIYGSLDFGGGITATNRLLQPGTPYRHMRLAGSISGQGTVHCHQEYVGDFGTPSNQLLLEPTANTFNGAWLVDNAASLSLANATYSLRFAAEEAFGVNPSFKCVRAIELQNNATLWPTASATLDDANRGLYIQRGKLKADAGTVFQNNLATTIDKECTLLGGGTIAFGGSVAGRGTLLVENATLRAETSDFTQVSLAFADGAKQELSTEGTGILLSSAPDIQGTLELSFVGEQPQGRFSLPVFTLPADAEIDLSGVRPQAIGKSSFVGWASEKTSAGVRWSAQYRSNQGTIIMLLGGN